MRSCTHDGFGADGQSRNPLAFMKVSKLIDDGPAFVHAQTCAETIVNVILKRRKFVRNLLAGSGPSAPHLTIRGLEPWGGLGVSGPDKASSFFASRSD